MGGDGNDQQDERREAEDATTAIQREQEITQSGSGSAASQDAGQGSGGTGPDESQLDPAEEDEGGRADAG